MTDTAPLDHVDVTLEKGSAARRRPAWSAQIAQGHSHLFTPANLPPPTWFVAVNPGHKNDAAAPVDIDVLNEGFEACELDALIGLVEKCDWDTVKSALLTNARADAETNAAYDNGALYAMWDLGDGQTALAGLDNGGSTLAQDCIRSLLELLGSSVVKTLYCPQFSASAPPGYDDAEDEVHKQVVDHITTRHTAQVLSMHASSSTPRPAPPPRCD